MTLLPANPPDTGSANDTLSQQLSELPAFRALLRAVEARFYADLPMPKPVLDLGCGDGHFTSVAFPQSLEVGLDPWWPPLRETRQRGLYKQLICGVGAQLPFPSAYFNTVVSNSVLEHITDVEPVIPEVARVLKPGGWFHFCVPGPNFRRFLSVARALDTIGLKGLAENYRQLFDRISRHYYYNTPEEWCARLEKAGFRLERWWSYFSPQALAALEWGHPLGLPSLLSKKFFNRWLLVPARWNLALTESLVRRYYEEITPGDGGAYLFFVARRYS